MLGVNSGLAPVVQTISVSVNESIGQSISSIITYVSSRASRNPEPVIVIYVPPAVVPILGVMLSITAVMLSS